MKRRDEDGKESVRSKEERGVALRRLSPAMWACRIATSTALTSHAFIVLILLSSLPEPSKQRYQPTDTLSPLPVFSTITLAWCYGVALGITLLL